MTSQHERDFATPPVFVSSGVAAEQLGISTQTLRRWVDEGLIPAARIGPRGLLRIRQSDVTAYLAGALTPG